MGIHTLTWVLARSSVAQRVRTSLTDAARAQFEKSGERLRVAVDGPSLFHCLDENIAAYFGLPDAVFLGALSEYATFEIILRNFVRVLRAHHIELLFFFDSGALGDNDEAKLGTLCQRKDQRIEQVVKFNNYCRGYTSSLDRVRFPIKLMEWSGRRVLDDMDVFHCTCLGEADHYIAAYAAEASNNVFGVLSDDSDFFVFPSIRYIRIDTFGLIGAKSKPDQPLMFDEAHFGGDGNLWAEVWTQQDSVEALGLRTVDELYLVAGLKGNDYTSSILPLPECTVAATLGLKTGARNLPTLDSCIGFVTALYSGDEGSVEAQKKLQQAMKSNAEFISKLHFSVEMYKHPHRMQENEVQLAGEDEHALANLIQRNAIPGGVLKLLRGGIATRSVAVEDLSPSVPSCTDVSAHLDNAFRFILGVQQYRQFTRKGVRYVLNFHAVPRFNFPAPPLRHLPIEPSDEHVAWGLQVLHYIAACAPLATGHGAFDEQGWMALPVEDSFVALCLIHILGASAACGDRLSEIEFTSLLLMCGILQQFAEERLTTCSLAWNWLERVKQDERLLRAATLCTRWQRTMKALSGVIRLLRVERGCQIPPPSRAIHGGLLFLLLNALSTRGAMTGQATVVDLLSKESIASLWSDEHLKIFADFDATSALCIGQAAILMFGRQLPELPVPLAAPNGSLGRNGTPQGRDIAMELRGALEGANDSQVRDGEASQAAPTRGESKGSGSGGETKSLPILAHKDAIVSMVKEHPITVIQGDTGCGKSSQVPQFLLEITRKSSDSGKLIVVTQPRRIAAVSLAKRVSEELSEPIGHSVGYCIGSDFVGNKGKKRTVLFFVTSGWLLQKVVFQPSFLNRCSHLVLDEIHERSVDADLLSLVVKQMLGEGYGTKLVLMSATFDAKLFANYFSEDLGVKPPYLHVGVKRYPVEEYYVDEIHNHPALVDLRLPFSSLTTMRLAKSFQSVNPARPPNPKLEESLFDIAAGLCMTLAEAHLNDADGNCVLVFLPGIGEIDDMFATLHEAKEQTVFGDNVELMTLHSIIEHEEQMRAFSTIEPSRTRVILSTNIAESSVTIPHVRYVIDFGTMRQVEHDDRANCDQLTTVWVSQASAKQRAGRTGRLFPGTVFRMYAEEFFHRLMDYDVPEMLRLSLASTVLRLKLLSEEVDEESVLKNPRGALLSALQPPSSDQITDAAAELIQFGALEEVSQKAHSSRDERADVVLSSNVTSFGRFVAHLPMSMQCGRLVALGTRMGRFLAHAMIIAVSIGMQELFVIPHSSMPAEKFGEMSMRAQQGRAIFECGDRSDCLMVIRLYRTWRDLDRRKALHSLWDCGVHLGRLRRLVQSVSHLARRLEPLLPHHAKYLQGLVWKREGVSAGVFNNMMDNLELTDDTSNVVRMMLVHAFMDQLVAGTPYTNRSKLRKEVKKVCGSDTDAVALDRCVHIENAPEEASTEEELRSALPHLSPFISRVYTGEGSHVGVESDLKKRNVVLSVWTEQATAQEEEAEPSRFRAVVIEFHPTSGVRHHSRSDTDGVALCSISGTDQPLGPRILMSQLRFVKGQGILDLPVGKGSDKKLYSATKLSYMSGIRWKHNGQRAYVNSSYSGVATLCPGLEGSESSIFAVAANLMMTGSGSYRAEKLTCIPEENGFLAFCATCLSDTYKVKYHRSAEVGVVAVEFETRASVVSIPLSMPLQFDDKMKLCVEEFRKKLKAVLERDLFDKPSSKLPRMVLALQSMFHKCIAWFKEVRQVAESHSSERPILESLERLHDKCDVDSRRKNGGEATNGEVGDEDDTQAATSSGSDSKRRNDGIRKGGSKREGGQRGRAQRGRAKKDSVSNGTSSMTMEKVPSSTWDDASVPTEGIGEENGDAPMSARERKLHALCARMGVNAKVNAKSSKKRIKVTVTAGWFELAGLNQAAPPSEHAALVEKAISNALQTLQSKTKSGKPPPISLRKELKKFLSASAGKLTPQALDRTYNALQWAEHNKMAANELFAVAAPDPCGLCSFSNRNVYVSAVKRDARFRVHGSGGNAVVELVDQS